MVQHYPTTLLWVVDAPTFSESERWKFVLIFVQSQINILVAVAARLHSSCRSLIAVLFR